MAVSELAREGLPIAPEGIVGEGDAGDEALAARGDTTGFVLLYRRHFTPVYRYLYVRLGSDEEAEDVAAEAWERVLTSLPGYKPTGPFRAWLFTIARRALADHYRRHRRRASHSDPLPLDDLSDALHDSEAGPEEQAIAHDEAQRVLLAVSRLGDTQQEVITLRFMAGLPYAEIAAVVGKSEAAVKMMAYRALDELKRLLGDE